MRGEEHKARRVRAGWAALVAWEECHPRTDVSESGSCEQLQDANVNLLIYYDLPTTTIEWSIGAFGRLDSFWVNAGQRYQ